MASNYLLDEIFDKIDYRDDFLAKGEYENCRFRNCDFSNSDLSGIKFIDCEFSGCNLSLVKLTTTVFRDVTFADCKMVGLHFENCNNFGLSFRFEGCSLNHSSFYQTKIKKTIFKNCQLQETDFSGTDLSGCLFDNCDLLNATFDNTNLEKTDLRTSANYMIDPENNRIKKAKFSLTGLPGLLGKYDIDIER